MFVARSNSLTHSWDSELLGMEASEKTACHCQESH